MKKLIIASVLFVMLIAGTQNYSTFTLLDYFSGEYFVYTTEEVKGAVDLGFCNMSTEKNVTSVVGESVKINNFEPVSALSTLNAELIKTEVLEDGTIVMYAYTNLINKNVVIDERKVNLQIAYKDESCVIGWPLILGSF